MNICAQAKELQPFMTEFRHDLHMHPELSMQEYRTTAKVKEQLDAWGVSYRCFDPTGLMVEICGNKGPGATVLLRADMDALPIQETTGLSFASQVPGVMHACGHDTHTTMLLGALRIILDHRDDFAGTLRFVFQPAEENGEGGECVLKQGAAEGASMCFGIHCAPDYPIGAFGCYPGGALAAACQFVLRVKGKAAHGATPHNSHDAVVAACEIVSALQTVVSRRIDPDWPVVLTVGRIQGGTAFNIISGECEMEGTCRFFNKELKEKMPAMMLEVAQNVAAAYGCTAELDFTIHSDVVYNSKEVTDIAWESVRKVIDTPDLILDYPRIMAGDDFGIYGNYAPSAYYFLGAGGNGPGHNGNFRVDDEMLRTGAAMYAQFGIDALDRLNNC